MQSDYLAASSWRGSLGYRDRRSEGRSGPGSRRPRRSIIPTGRLAFEQVNRRSDQCIEGMAFNGSRSYYSIAEYEEGRRAAREFSGSDRSALLAISWGFDAPPPEKLTNDWTRKSKPFGQDSFRICDRKVYDAQMRELLGIA